MPRPIPRLLRRAALPAAAALASVALLAGCAAPSAATGGAASGSSGEAGQACRGTEIPFAEVAFATDARELEGPSTACLADAGLPMIESDEEPAVPLTVTDADGEEVTVSDASRILALDISGTLAATVFGLGLGDRVVGRDGSTGFAEASDLPVVTQDGHSLSAESILALDPTVVLTDTTLGPRDVLEQLRDAGIPVVITTSERRVDNVEQVVAEVADALGVPGRGKLLSDAIQGDLDDIAATIAAGIPAEAADRPRTIFLYVRGSANVYYLFGEESGADSLIDAVGGYDVAGEIGWQGMRPVTAEAIAAAQPELVLLMTGGLESVGGVDGLLEKVPALATTPAGEHRRFVDMADTEILGFGPRTPAVVEALARAIWAPASSGHLGSDATPQAGSDD
ncbi:hemin ABC transporter substrate-binding protein [Agromyces sp. MMS24-K17]|uniref:heme/hemin ABC transporter substrate-binding protein n=1 Tax=Agromyces sp. MMS24-K17 TaxID=3372850 RepID=UPI0037549012